MVPPGGAKSLLSPKTERVALFDAAIFRIGHVVMAQNNL